jgi:hypothetical protein
MTPIDPVLTSIARQEIPDAYVIVRVTQGGNRIVCLHAGNHNAQQSVADSIVPSVDPLRVALERLIDGYFAARRPGNGTSWCTAQDYESPEEAA